MNPGDMIEWVYKQFGCNNQPVDKNEMLWSTSMQKYVSIDCRAVLISITVKEYTWLSERGLFCAWCTDCMAALGGRGARAVVVPRVVLPTNIETERDI